jgi:hypothetical protein
LTEIVLPEVAIHKLAIDETSVREGSSGKLAIQYFAVDEIAPSEQTPIPINALKNTAHEL